MTKDKNVNTIFSVSKYTIEILRGLTETLRENLKTEKAENEKLISKIAALERENHQLREQLLENTYDESLSDDEQTVWTLKRNLTPYYKDLSLYREKHISLEDGERLYHTINYIFKQLKKAGIDL